MLVQARHLRGLLLVHVPNGSGATQRTGANCNRRVALLVTTTFQPSIPPPPCRRTVIPSTAAIRRCFPQMSLCGLRVTCCAFTELFFPSIPGCFRQHTLYPASSSPCGTKGRLRGGLLRFASWRPAVHWIGPHLLLPCTKVLPRSGRCIEQPFPVRLTDGHPSSSVCPACNLRFPDEIRLAAKQTLNLAWTRNTQVRLRKKMARRTVMRERRFVME